MLLDGVCLCMLAHLCVVYCWVGAPQLVGWLQGTLNLPLPWLHEAQVRFVFVAVIAGIDSTV
jgi:hypothetical protein